MEETSHLSPAVAIANYQGLTPFTGICVEASTQPGRVGGGWKANYQGLTPFTAGGGNAWPQCDRYIGVAARCQARQPHTGGWPLIGSDASVALPRGAADSRCHSQKRSVSNRGSPPACPGGEGIGAAAGNGNSRDASWNTDSQVLSTKVSPYAHSPKTINLVPRSSSMVHCLSSKPGW